MQCGLQSPHTLRLCVRRPVIQSQTVFLTLPFSLTPHLLCSKWTVGCSQYNIHIFSEVVLPPLPIGIQFFIQNLTQIQRLALINLSRNKTCLLYTHIDIFTLLLRHL